jgi:hypothetical protein
MLFTARESLEDIIIRLISKGKTTPEQLYEYISEHEKNCTIQAVYKALRYLIKSSVIVKSGKQLELSQEWIDTLSQAFSTQTNLPKLADGESAVYNYKSLINLDAYWKHLMKALEDKFSQSPIFLYSPYHIWYHISERTQSEADYFNSYQINKRYGFFVIGNSTTIDQNFKKKFQSEYLQIDTWTKTPFNNDDYLTIMDDYIIYSILDKKLTRAIESYYFSNLPLEQATERLNQVLSAPSKSKIKIERNSKKAKRLRKQLSKNFFIPKGLKEKFELF